MTVLWKAAESVRIGSKVEVAGMGHALYIHLHFVHSLWNIHAQGALIKASPGVCEGVFLLTERRYGSASKEHRRHRLSAVLEKTISNVGSCTKTLLAKADSIAHGARLKRAILSLISFAICASII